MKQLLTTLSAVAFLLFGVNTQAQTVDEIVDNYFEAIGGRENVAAIKSMKATCQAKVQGMELPVTMLQTSPNKQKIDIFFQGKEITQLSFNGETGWSTNFMTMEAEAWDKEQSEIMKAQSSFPDPFLDYKEKGYTLELMGEEEIEGVPCFKLKYTRAPVTVDGKEEENATIYFFDKENFVPIMQRDYALTGPQKGMATETYLSDYDEVEGMFFAHTLTQRINGQDVSNISITEIELNVEVPAGTFDMPEKKTEDGNK
jgi:hypothetical protein